MQQLKSFIVRQKQQQTIAQPVSFSGLGVHTGQEVCMRFVPAPPNTGIFFKRTDLPGQPSIPARVSSVCDTSRSTTLGIENVRVHTVEHVLAAVYAMEIDNLIIEVSNLEPPIGDGSSQIFLQLLEQAGRSLQQQTVPIVKLEKPVYWSAGEVHLAALPSDHYRISYTLHYPGSPVLKAQFFSLAIDKESFKNQIAPCRTFSLYQEIELLMDRGLIKGGSLDNAVVIHGNAVFSKEGLHYPDEMVRHKILDMVGDLSLVGIRFEAHIMAIRSGHATNIELAKQILDHITMRSS